MPRRGAQPGNINALKHGFYSTHFTRGEIESLDPSISAGLLDEIALLKVLVRRLFDYAEDPTSLDSMCKTMSTLSDSLTCLSGLCRTQKLLGGTENNQIMNALSEALKAVQDEIKSQ
jgi:hypothetical protein